MAATFKNFATTKLTQNLSASAVTAYINAADSDKLPVADGADKWFYLVLQRATDTSYFEIVKVTNKVGGTLTIVREQEGTIAKAFLVNDLAEARLTAASLVDAFVSRSDWALWAMPQAQFEAIREQNKEKYAASGFVHFGKHAQQLPAIVNVDEGLWTFAAASFENTLVLGRSADYARAGKSSKNNPVVNIAGVLFDFSVFYPAIGETPIRFPQAPDGRTTYNKATGVVTTHATVTAAFDAQAADPANVEVVTDRVDMWGFEAFLEEVNTTNPYVYPNGLIQSQAATMDGITTSASNRPVTYYAVFGGDTGSKGKGVNFFALTDAQKKKVLGNAKNNLYYLDDGRLAQWRLRQRTIAGAGNGDWEKVDSMTGDSLKVNNKLNITAQGQLDYRDPFVLYEVGANSYRSSVDALNYKKNIGVYTVLYTSNDTAVNGECYFLVCGTINRLNQGAYHPSFNPSGSAKFCNVDGGSAVYWHDGYVRVASTTQDCFTLPTTGYPFSDGFIYSESGKINGVGGSGRPDGRYYDAIYASGQGGVCRDMRYSAYGVDLVDFAEADQRVKNGTYRGFEKLVFTKVIKSAPSDCLNGLLLNKDNSTIGWVSGYVPKGTGSGLGFSNEAKVSIVLDGVVIAKGKLSQPERVHSDGSWYAIVYWDTDGVPANTTYACTDSSFLIIQDTTSSSVGGSFLQTDVIAPPAIILATPALANGWQGSWGGLPVNGAPIQVPLSRKCLSSQVYTVYKTAGGWGVSSTELVTPSSNTVAHAATDVNSVLIEQYQAYAKQTEGSSNGVVYGGLAGVHRNVDALSWYDVGYGSSLVESCIGKVLTNSNGDSSVSVNEGCALLSVTLDPAGDIHWYRPSQLPRHSALSIGAPLGATLAMKALCYDSSKNNQASLKYNYTELKYSGSSWGDDGRVAIHNASATKLDSNGNTVLVGTAELKEPIGWLKNKV